jgi:hypothetical protein
MLFGITGAVCYLQSFRPLPAAVWKKILFAKRVWILALLVLLIRIYGAFLEADMPDGSPLVEILRTEFTHFRIPPLAVIMLIPFICGMTTGIAVGFVGASFPVIMSLMGQQPSHAQLLPVIALAYGCGYMGMILSPVHVCLIVTNQHFRTPLYDTIKKLIPPAAVMLTLIFAYFLLLRLVLQNL